MQMERIELESASIMRGIPHSLGTREYFTCIQGEVIVAVEGESYTVMENDVLAFPGNTRHSYQNSGSGKAVGISVVVLAPSKFE
jgi:quercetin dioxygenase-like cupin family protein